MKTLMLVLLGTLFFFNKTVAQNRDLLLMAGQWEAVSNKRAGSGISIADTGKINLFFGKADKPLVSFQADFSKSSGWLNLTVKDTTGNIRLQSLLQVIENDLIQWQLFDSTQTGRPTSAKGQILFKGRSQ